MHPFGTALHSRLHGLLLARVPFHPPTPTVLLPDLTAKLPHSKHTQQSPIGASQLNAASFEDGTSPRCQVLVLDERAPHTARESTRLANAIRTRTRASATLRNVRTDQKGKVTVKGVEVVAVVVWLEQKEVNTARRPLRALLSIRLVRPAVLRMSALKRPTATFRRKRGVDVE